MPDQSNGKRTYMALGLLDFLAYYVPGVLTLVFGGVLATVFEIRFGNFMSYVTGLSDDKYINAAAWTVLALTVPYVIGHLIFPLGYILSSLFFRAAPIRDAIPLRIESTVIEQCPILKAHRFCQPNSIGFADCLFRCFQKSTAAFNDLMITRFRTLSRFCRSMLFPTILLSAMLVLVAIYRLAGPDRLSIVILAVSAGLAVVAFVGFGRRHRSYETRWRTGVCVAGCESSQVAEAGGAKGRSVNK